MGDEENKIKYVPNFIVAILGSIYTLIILCILLVIPILELAFGSSYRTQCPVEPNIPIYLIVTGACGLACIVLTIVTVLAFLLLLKKSSTGMAVAVGCVVGIILLFIILTSFFLFAWFIVGNVWIFGVYSKVDLDNDQSPNYCHRTLYQFAFAILIMTYAMSVLSCCCSCCRSCYQLKSATRS